MTTRHKPCAQHSIALAKSICRVSYCAAAFKKDQVARRPTGAASALQAGGYRLSKFRTKANLYALISNRTLPPHYNYTAGEEKWGAIEVLTLCALSLPSIV